MFIRVLEDILSVFEDTVCYATPVGAGWTYENTVHHTCWSRVDICEYCYATPVGAGWTYENIVMPLLLEQGWYICVLYGCALGTYTW